MTWSQENGAAAACGGDAAVQFDTHVGTYWCGTGE
jgi:hypothetical protein